MRVFFLRSLRSVLFLFSGTLREFSPAFVDSNSESTAVCGFKFDRRFNGKSFMEFD
jgi:hypothetical protein